MRSLLGRRKLCRVNFALPLSKTRAKQKARKNWDYWRLVLSDIGIDYNTAFHQMTPDEVAEANAALDLYDEALRKGTNSK